MGLDVITQSTTEPTPSQSPKPTPEPTPKSTDTVVSGSMKLVVVDAEAFVASEKASAGVAKGIARNLQIPVRYIDVRLSIPLRRMQASGNLRRLGVDVQVDYTITFPAEDSASYDVNEIAERITDASEDDVATAAMLKAIQESVAAEDSNLPAITALTVMPPVVTKGSSDTKFEVESEDQG